MLRRRAMRRMVRRRRRRRLIIGGMLVVGTASAMRKLTQQDAEKIQQTTGKSPEEMEPEELDQAMAQAGIQAQPVTPEDQQARRPPGQRSRPDEEVEAGVASPSASLPLQAATSPDSAASNRSSSSVFGPPAMSGERMPFDAVRSRRPGFRRPARHGRQGP